MYILCKMGYVWQQVQMMDKICVFLNVSISIDWNGRFHLTHSYNNVFKILIVITWSDYPMTHQMTYQKFTSLSSLSTFYPPKWKCVECEQSEHWWRWYNLLIHGSF